MRNSFFLIRLDDACPTMNRELWGKVEDILDKYQILPMVGVIPNNEDSKQLICPPDKSFWEKVKVWEEKGWAIALHGYNHVYSSKAGGLNPIWKKSEFAGHPYDIQKEKIHNGISIMREHGLEPKYFFAPSHTFDDNTLTALEQETSIQIISDTFALAPYKYRSFIFIPQQLGSPRNIKLGGLWTICLHPNTMKERDFASLGVFCRDNKRKIIDFDQVDLTNVRPLTMRDKIFRYFYFLLRKIR